MNFLSTKENKFVYNNTEVILKGIGLGNWLNLEHFMFGLPGTDSQIREAILNEYGEDNYNTFWDKYYSVYISEQDIKFIHSLGMNHVRIAINHNLFNKNNFDSSIAIRELNKLIEYLKKYNIWGIIDIHTVPGGQNPDWHSDNYSGVDNFWTDKNSKLEIIDLWSKIANYYKNEPIIGGFDLINEPCYFNKSNDLEMISFFEACTKAIREVNTNHIIFYSGNTYSRDFSMFSKNLDFNSAYTFHLYPFLQIPQKINSKNCKKELLESLHKDVTLEHLTNKLKKPLWCGETGHPLHLAQNSNILQEFISILESKNIGWALWPLKDCGQMALTFPKKDGKWNTICKQLSNNWCFWNLFTQDSFLATQGKEDKYEYYKWLANESTDAWKITKDNFKNLPFNKLLDALNDFKFENCLRNNSIN